MSPRGYGASVLILAVVGCPLLPTHAQMGHVMNGVGPINQSMAGATVGNPIDPCGALYWNPASTSAFDKSSVDLSVELFWPSIELGSSVTMPTTPPMVIADTTKSEFNLSAIPTLCALFPLEDSPWTLGVGAYGISGFGVDYKQSGTNPILMPQPNGFGSIYSDYQLMQIYPTAAYELSESWSLGIAPTLDISSLTCDPFPGTVPGPAGYPNSSTQWAVGGGVQGGVYYESGMGINAGATIKSPQYFTDFDFVGSDGSRFDFNLGFPMIVAGGVGYSGLERWEFSADIRYIDYTNTEGFQRAGFAPDMSVQGFGWDSIVSVAVGAQYEILDGLRVRAGYAWNQNPIASDVVFFNVHAPAIIQHHLGVGISYSFLEHWTVALAYTHGFENSVEGPMYQPGLGAVPGTSVKSTMSTDSVVIGVGYQF